MREGTGALLVAVVSEGPGPQHVKGCRVSTPNMEVTVTQISGWEQATMHPETESWAAPYTWYVLLVLYARQGLGLAWQCYGPPAGLSVL